MAKHFNFVPLVIFASSADYLARTGEFNPVLTRYAKHPAEMTGYPLAMQFFGTMRAKFWDTIVTIESLMPIHVEFWKTALDSSNRGYEFDHTDIDTCLFIVKRWLFNACEAGLISSAEKTYLSAMVGSR